MDRLRLDYLRHHGLFLSWPVAKLAARQEEDQQRRYPKSDQDGQVQLGKVHGGEERHQSKLGCVDASMDQDRQENTSPGVVIDPGKEDRQGDHH